MAIEPGVNGARSVARRGSGSGGAERRRRRIHVVQVLGNAIGGGMERWVLDIVARLPRERFKVSCVCPFESPCTAAMRELGCEVYIAPMHDEPRWRSIQLLVEVIRHFGVDLLHAHMPAAHVLAGLAGGLTGTPVLATIHGMNVAGHQPHDRHVPIGGAGDNDYDIAAAVDSITADDDRGASLLDLMVLGTSKVDAPDLASLHRLLISAPCSHASSGIEFALALFQGFRSSRSSVLGLEFVREGTMACIGCHARERGIDLGPGPRTRSPNPFQLAHLLTLPSPPQPHGCAGSALAGMRTPRAGR